MFNQNKQNPVSVDGDHSRKYRILVVDDEEINLKILRIYLEDKGYDVISTLSGEEAIEILKEEDVTVCICDIRMPKISGIDVLNFVQQSRPIIPVIMLTGFIEINTAVSVMRQGATNYITKPIDAGELIIAVEKAIEHRKLLEDKHRLEKENLEYRRELEEKVELKGHELEGSKMDMVVSLANIMEQRNKYLVAHCKRVSQYANMLGRQLELPRAELNTINYAAALHDIGRASLPDAIVIKEPSGDEEEDKLIRSHIERGVNIVEPVSFLESCLPAIKSHHEHWDGSGYPEGLAGEDIPLLARIVSIANGFDVMTTSPDRADSVGVEAATKYLEENKGKLFDPKLVDTFMVVVRKIVARFPKQQEG